MFDIFILLFLGVLSIIMIDLAFKSKRAFKKAKVFADMQLEIMNDNRQMMKSMSQDLKDIGTSFRSSIINTKQSGVQCEKYSSGECKLCGGTGDCLLNKVNIINIIEAERMATKPQRTVSEK
jgi:hypothetical protein